MEITVTLQKAHKILESLKQLKNTVTSENIGFLRQTVSVTAAEPHSKFVAGVEAGALKIAANIQKETDILLTIGLVKSRIFQANAKCGVNGLIEDIAAAQQILVLKKRILAATQVGYPGIADISQEFYDKTIGIEMEARNSNINFKVSVLNSDGLDVEIRDLQKQINAMVDAKTELNASQKIDLNIPDSLVDDLML